MTDIAVTDLGSIIILEALTKRGKAWMRANVEGRTTYAQCDHRFGFEIAQAAHDAGLMLQPA